MFQSHEPVHLILAADNDKQLRAGKNVVCALYFVRTQHFSFSVLQTKKNTFCFLTLTNFLSLNTLKWTYSDYFNGVEYIIWTIRGRLTIFTLSTANW
jgi:hypothetical protein